MTKTNFSVRSPSDKKIDEYIKTFPKDIQKTLEQVRRTIKETAPDAEEVISHQIPAFKFPPKADEPLAQNGSYLIYFAG